VGKGGRIAFGVNNGSTGLTIVGSNAVTDMRIVTQRLPQQRLALFPLSYYSFAQSATFEDL
jgi:hypothetical protein